MIRREDKDEGKRVTAYSLDRVSHMSTMILRAPRPSLIKRSNYPQALPYPDQVQRDVSPISISVARETICRCLSSVDSEQKFDVVVLSLPHVIAFLPECGSRQQ